jgi:hypothetical protein
MGESPAYLSNGRMLSVISHCYKSDLISQPPLFNQGELQGGCNQKLEEDEPPAAPAIKKNGSLNRQVTLTFDVTRLCQMIRYTDQITLDSLIDGWYRKSNTMGLFFSTRSTRGRSNRQAR